MMEIREHCLLTAKQAINNKQYPQAHQALVQAIRQTGDFEEAYFLLGIIHIELMQISKAAALLEKVLSSHFWRWKLRFITIFQCILANGVV